MNNELKGEADFRNTFIIFSVLLFAFFTLDISMTSVVLGHTLTQVINVLPLVRF